MQFTSLTFVVFFVFVLGLHHLPLSWRARKWNLVWTSCVFYGAWNPPFLLLLWASTLLDWEVGKRMAKENRPGRRRMLLGLSLLGNLGMLAYFKYGGFVLENVAALLNAIGVAYQPPAFDVVLPIGISFYTFQTLCYSLDIYMRRMEPCSDFVDYALSVSFFPQLVAGPIVRPAEFLPQCERPTTVSRDVFAWGMCLFVMGVFLKSVVADGLLAHGVEDVFDGRRELSTAQAWAGSLGFMSQIYCDFSGYSLCAIGIGKCLGFELPTNFRFPLAAVGFQDMWRRWHITLSTWLRDYVYVPMQTPSGAAKKPRTHWSIAVLVTWTLVGLWHGASWGFVLWGLLAGCYVIVERLLRSTVPAYPIFSTTPVQVSFAAITTLGFASMSTFFRAPTLDRSWHVGRALLGMTETSGIGTASLKLAGITLCLFVGNWLLRDRSLEDVAVRTPWPLRTLLLAAMMLAIALTPNEDRAFIYFQF